MIFWEKMSQFLTVLKTEVENPKINLLNYIFNKIIYHKISILKFQIKIVSLIKNWVCKLYNLP